jgi:hypothetical protein
MAIITPTENNIYDCNAPIWFLDNSAIINFLGDQTKFTKETLPGLPYKITWDNSEHIINNPSNFSYQIINAVKTLWSVRGLASWFLFGSNSSGSINRNFMVASFAPVTVSDIIISNSITVRQESSGTALSCYSTAGTLHTTTSTNFTAYLPITVDGVVIYGRLVGNPNGQSLTANLSGLTIQECTNSPNKKIKITDNNIVYEYPITNINSVQVINSIGQITYKFFDIDNNIIIEKLENAEKTVKLQCGKDCPPGTCIKCRNFDLVCCYGGNGKVIEIINDPNHEIEAC